MFSDLFALIFRAIASPVHYACQLFGAMKPSDDRMQLSGLTQSEESSLDVEGHCSHHEAFPCSPSMQPVASGCVHTENSAAYFLWPTSNLQHCAAEGRANYFGNLQKGLLPVLPGKLPKGQQANSLLDLMTIRAFHSKILRRFSLGTAVGFRITKGALTETPAILVFVARKVHKKWLNPNQCLPAILAVREPHFISAYIFGQACFQTWNRFFRWLISFTWLDYYRVQEVSGVMLML